MKADIDGFRERLQALREERHMSARALSMQIGKGEAYIQALESGLRNKKVPSVEIVAAIAEALETTSDYLVYGENPALSRLPLSPEIQATPLAELLRRIGAMPNLRLKTDRPFGHAGDDGAPLVQGFDESRQRRPAPKGKGKDKDVERYQDIEVIGHCMEDVLYPGDVVTVDTQVLPNFGDVVVGMRFHDEVLVKFLKFKDEHQYLESKDGQIIPLDQYIRILGPVVFVQVSIRRLL